MKTSKLLIVDLEATCSEDSSIRRSDMEIIEIGAAIVALDTFSLIDSFQLYVKPVVNRTLTLFCTQLTGIEQSTVDSAEPFFLAVEAYRAWLRDNGEIFAWASWGNYDIGQFELDYARHGVSDLHAGLPHLNLKNLFGQAVGEKRMGLGKAIEFVGAKFEGRHHSGRDDAVNMALLLTHSPAFGALIQSETQK